MRYLTFAVLGLLGNGLAYSDEVVLKSGQRIEWKTITDKGDAYEVQTAAGKTVTVAKRDVASLAISEPRGEAPLMGATFTFDRGRKAETINLFRLVNPKRDAIVGNWDFSGGALNGETKERTHAKIEIPYTPPEQYDLTMTLERREGVKDLGVGLVAPNGSQFFYSFESLSANWCGVWLGESPPNSSGIGIQKKIFEPGKERSIKFMVRREAFIVQVDGKDFQTWKPQWDRVSLHPALAVSKKNTLFLTSYQSAFRIRSATVTFLK